MAWKENRCCSLATGLFPLIEVTVLYIILLILGFNSSLDLLFIRKNLYRCTNLKHYFSFHCSGKSTWTFSFKGNVIHVILPYYSKRQLYFNLITYDNLFLILNIQGYNARKVISEVYASFVLQCTVSGR